VTCFSGSSGFGRTRRTSHKSKAHHVHKQVNLFLDQPVPDEHMTFNTGHKGWEKMDPTLLKRTDCVVDVGFFLEQVFTEKQKGNFLALVNINSAFFQPAFITLDILEVSRSIRMVETHIRNINNCPYSNALIEIFTQNKPEHVGNIIRSRLHPVGINQQPVLEILCLVWNKRQDGTHDFHELHVTIQSIFIAPFHQHIGYFFHHIRHPRLSITD